MWMYMYIDPYIFVHIHMYSNHLHLKIISWRLHVCIYVHIYVYKTYICIHTHVYLSSGIWLGWLRLAGSFKLCVVFGKEPYKRDDILPKRPKILRSLLIVATPYQRLKSACVYIRVYINIHRHIYMYIDIHIFVYTLCIIFHLSINCWILRGCIYVYICKCMNICVCI